MGSITTRPYRHGDEKEIITLLDQVFEGWPRFDIESEIYWNWKYKKNPLKSTFTTVAEAGDKIVGCMHGIPQIMKIGNNQYFSVHGTDVAVHPDYRRLGIYNKMSTLQMQIEANESIFFHYGVTGNPILIKKYKKRGDFFLSHQPKLYVKIKDFELHEKHTEDLQWIKKIGYNTLSKINKFGNIFLKPLNNKKITIKRTNTFGNEVIDFWNSVSSHYDFIVKRDENYLNWRYCDPLNPRYIVFQALLDDQLQGYCVVAINNINKEYPVGYIVDFLTKPDCSEVSFSLFAYADEFFVKNDVNFIQCKSFSGPLFRRIASVNGYLDGRSPFMMNINRDSVQIGADEKKIRDSPPEKLHFVYGDSDWI